MPAGSFITWRRAWDILEPGKVARRIQPAAARLSPTFSERTAVHCCSTVLRNKFNDLELKLIESNNYQSLGSVVLVFLSFSLLVSTAWMFGPSLFFHSYWICQIGGLLTCHVNTRMRGWINVSFTSWLVAYSNWNETSLAQSLGSLRSNEQAVHSFHHLIIKYLNSGGGWLWAEQKIENPVACRSMRLTEKRAAKRGAELLVGSNYKKKKKKKKNGAFTTFVHFFAVFGWTIWTTAWIIGC